jgi:hypothetical protein
MAHSLSGAELAGTAAAMVDAAANSNDGNLVLALLRSKIALLWPAIITAVPRRRAIARPSQTPIPNSTIPSTAACPSNSATSDLQIDAANSNTPITSTVDCRRANPVWINASPMISAAAEQTSTTSQRAT